MMLARRSWRHRRAMPPPPFACGRFAKNLQVYLSFLSRGAPCASLIFHSALRQTARFENNPGNRSQEPAMYAAVANAFDAPPRDTTFAGPLPAEGEKIVSVSAAGLHPIVKGLARGTHYGSSGELPFIAGIDGVGTLEDGTRVYFGVARSPFGTFCERSLAA